MKQLGNKSPVAAFPPEVRLRVSDGGRRSPPSVRQAQDDDQEDGAAKGEEKHPGGGRSKEGEAKNSS